MREALLNRLCALTPEEERLLSGAPLDKNAYTSDPSFLIQSRKMLPPGQAITLRPHTRFVDFPFHRHDFVEIMYVLHGHALHTMEDGAEIDLQAGELLLINCHTGHKIRRCEARDAAVNLIVMPAYFDFALETVGPANPLGRFLIDALRAGEKETPYLYFQVGQVEAVQCVMESLLLSLLSYPQGKQLLHKTGMTLLFLHLLENTERMTLSSLHRGGALAVSLLQEIQRNYPSLRFDAFAAAHGVSPAYLSKLTREATGKSCTELLQARRLKKARELLLQTDLSVLEICAAVGYANSSYFYRLFEKNEGVSPAQFRRKNRAKG